MATADFFQAEVGIRDVERSRGLGDVYKRKRPIRNIIQKKIYLKRIASHQLAYKKIKIKAS